MKGCTTSDTTAATASGVHGVTRRTLGAAVVLSLFATLAKASSPTSPEKAFYSSEELREVATHVVVGTIERIELARTLEGFDQYERCVATLRVESVEQGAGLEPASVLAVRYWTREWLAPTSGPAGTLGHDPLPSTGARVRAYLVNDGYNGFGETTDGGFDVVGRNGWEILAGPTSSTPPVVVHDWRVRAGVGASAIALAAALVLVARRRRRASGWERRAPSVPAGSSPSRVESSSR